MVGLMLLGLAMAIAIPHAFAGEAGLFAASYVVINLGRSAFMARVGGEPGSEPRALGRDQLLWFSCSSVLWIAGAVLDGTPRAACWVVALLWDSAGPLVGFRIPGLARHSYGQPIGAEHYRLFVLIALGESIVVTGSTASGLHLDVARAAAFVLTFAIAVQLWWLYFARIATIARARLAEPDGKTLARDLFTYLHAPLIAGIVVSAVGNRLVIAHPGDPLHGARAVAVVAGPFLYLLAQNVMRFRGRGDLSESRTLGMAGCVAIAFVAPHVPGLVVAACLVALLLAVIALASKVRPDPMRARA